MATTQAATDAVTRDGVVRRGNWTEERRGIMDKIPREEIIAEVLRQQIEQPERFNIKSVRANAEMVGA